MGYEVPKIGYYAKNKNHVKYEYDDGFNDEFSGFIKYIVDRDKKATGFAKWLPYGFTGSRRF